MSGGSWTSIFREAMREAHNPIQVQVPPRALGHPPFKSAPAAGVTVEVDDLCDRFLDQMDWDPVTGLPSQSHLTALGLDQLVATLHPGIELAFGGVWA